MPKEQYCAFCGGPTFTPLERIREVLIKNDDLRESLKIDKEDLYVSVIDKNNTLFPFAWLENISVLALNNKVFHDGIVGANGEVFFSYRPGISCYDFRNDVVGTRKGFIVHTVCWNIAGKPKITDVPGLLSFCHKYQRESFDFEIYFEDGLTTLEDPRKNIDNKINVLKRVDNLQIKI